MSYKSVDLYPCNPATTRGESTKLSAHKDKIAYTNGRTVIIRDLKAIIANSGHVQSATVARISPTGYYCASADASGTVRIWDLVGEDQTVKSEYKVISGRIKDLAWDGESKRIIAVGEGRDKFGHAFMVDSGSSTGEIIGHSKVVNAVAIRHQRPFRAATGGDDNTIVFHQGVPFKYDKAIKTHTKFVQDIKYASSGDQFVSVGSDAKIFLYDGKTGDTLAEITDSPHTGTINAVSWSPDDKSLLTSSADRTVKLWDAESRKLLTSWTLGTTVEHQQVGNVWTDGGDIVSLSVSGDLNVFDKRVDDKPARILRGPAKSISAAVPTSTNNTFIAGLSDGRVLSFSGSEYDYVEGVGHKSLVSGLVMAPDGKVYSAGYDDLLKEISPNGSSFVPATYSTEGQPKSLAIASDSTIFIAEPDRVEAIRSNQKVYELKTKYVPTAVGASGLIVAIGGEDQKVHLHDWDGKTLKEVAMLENNKGAISALAFSPDGSLLVAGDSSGKVVLYDVKERKLVTGRWSFHSGRILSLAWTADGQHVASSALDTHVYIWSIKFPLRNISIKNAAAGGVNVVFWVDGQKKLAGTGADGVVRTWDITFHA
ncbi:WD40-repeat-containing domain protein [Irpex rosettiformis]|uniref:WD40-repeat-containing domain protein n=1 Tax=Irpex rosettiformis TaxID=378272 RepID=A0ACB8TQ51_9APHY|nr:WD40-repeat-containing domain protein [Irpex rosettiformis]